MMELSVEHNREAIRTSERVKPRFMIIVETPMRARFKDHVMMRGRGGGDVVMVCMSEPIIITAANVLLGGKKQKQNSGTSAQHLKASFCGLLLLYHGNNVTCIILL